MKILIRSVSMIVAIGFTAFGEEMEHTALNAVFSEIMAEGGDADLDETRCCPFF
jgi:hypothetical protein